MLWLKNVLLRPPGLPHATSASPVKPLLMPHEGIWVHTNTAEPTQHHEIRNAEKVASEPLGPDLWGRREAEPWLPFPRRLVCLQERPPGRLQPCLPGQGLPEPAPTRQHPALAPGRRGLGAPLQQRGGTASGSLSALPKTSKDRGVRDTAQQALLGPGTGTSGIRG